MTTVQVNGQNRRLPRGYEYFGFRGSMAVYCHRHPFTGRWFHVIEQHGGFYVSEMVPTGKRIVREPGGEREIRDDELIQALVASPNSFYSDLEMHGLTYDVIDRLVPGHVIGLDRHDSLKACKATIDHCVLLNEWLTAVRPATEEEKETYILIDAYPRMVRSAKIRNTMKSHGYGGEHWLAGMPWLGKKDPETDPRMLQVNAYLENPTAEAWEHVQRIHLPLVGLSEACASAGLTSFPSADELKSAVRQALKAVYERASRDYDRLSAKLGYA